MNQAEYYNLWILKVWKTHSHYNDKVESSSALTNLRRLLKWICGSHVCNPDAVFKIFDVATISFHLSSLQYHDDETFRLSLADFLRAEISKPDFSNFEIASRLRQAPERRQTVFATRPSIIIRMTAEKLWAHAWRMSTHEIIAIVASLSADTTTKRKVMIPWSIAQCL